MHRTASLAEWHKTIGKHEIFTKGRAVDLHTVKHDLIIPAAGSLKNNGNGNSAAPNQDKEIPAAIKAH